MGGVLNEGLRYAGCEVTAGDLANLTGSKRILLFRKFSFKFYSLVDVTKYPAELKRGSSIYLDSIS